MRRERTPVERFLLLAGLIVAVPIVLAALAALLALCVLVGMAITSHASAWLIGGWSILLGVMLGGAGFFALLFVVGRKVVRG